MVDGSKAYNKNFIIDKELPMDKNKYSDLSSEELIEQAQKNKKYTKYDVYIFGFLAGIAIYSTVINGFGLLTFLPFLYSPAAAKNRSNMKEITHMLEERNLEL